MVGNYYIPLGLGSWSDIYSAPISQYILKVKSGDFLASAYNAQPIALISTYLLFMSLHFRVTVSYSVSSIVFTKAGRQLSELGVRSQVLSILPTLK